MYIHGVDRYITGSGHSSLVNRAAGVQASNLTRHGRVGTDTVHLGIIAVGLKWPDSAELRKLRKYDLDFVELGSGHWLQEFLHLESASSLARRWNSSVQVHNYSNLGSTNKLITLMNSQVRMHKFYFKNITYIDLL